MSFPTLYLGSNITIDGDSKEIKVETKLNVPTPTENTDIVNKKYVDDRIASIIGSLSLFKKMANITKEYDAYAASTTTTEQQPEEKQEQPEEKQEQPEEKQEQQEEQKQQEEKNPFSTINKIE